LKCVHPDNVIQLSDNKILKIDAILLNKQNNENKLKLKDLYLLERGYKPPHESFKYPILWKEVGIKIGAKFFGI